MTKTKKTGKQGHANNPENNRVGSKPDLRPFHTEHDVKAKICIMYIDLTSYAAQ